jgi:hypothetical protein
MTFWFAPADQKPLACCHGQPAGCAFRHCNWDGRHKSPLDRLLCGDSHLPQNADEYALSEVRCINLAIKSQPESPAKKALPLTIYFPDQYLNLIVVPRSA